MTFISILDVDKYQKFKKRAFTLKISTIYNSLKGKKSMNRQNPCESSSKIVVSN